MYSSIGAPPRRPSVRTVPLGSGSVRRSFAPSLPVGAPHSLVKIMCWLS